MTHSDQAPLAPGAELRHFLTLCLTHAETALESKRVEDMENSLAAILATARELQTATRAAHRRTFTSRLADSQRRL